MNLDTPLLAFLPDDATLTERLQTVLRQGPIELLERRPITAGTFPKEVVRFRSRAGTEHAMFCKYSADRHPAFGHRGGMAHEAMTYVEVLRHTNVTTPSFVASGEDDRGGLWLILDHLADAVRLSEAYDRLPAAAAWLGSFHAEHERRASDSALSFLTRYDLEYYRGWAARTLRFAESREVDAPWLRALTSRFDDLVLTLLAADPTVIHGEFTIHNVMVRGVDIVPTDWESAAVGAGEIDLMCLVDRWPADAVAACVEEYVRSRWGTAPPANLTERLLAAELYLHFRWLGEDPETILLKKRVWRFGRLQMLAASVGLP